MWSNLSFLIYQTGKIKERVVHCYMLWLFDFRFRTKSSLTWNIQLLCWWINRYSGNYTCLLEKWFLSISSHKANASTNNVGFWECGVFPVPTILSSEKLSDIEIQFPSRFRKAILQLPDKIETGKLCYYILNFVIWMHLKPDFIFSIIFRALYLDSLHNSEYWDNISWYTASPGRSDHWTQDCLSIGKLHVTSWIAGHTQ